MIKLQYPVLHLLYDVKNHVEFHTCIMGPKQTKMMLTKYRC